MTFADVYFPHPNPGEPKQPRDYRYNCHIFTAAGSGWITVGAYDPNLCGWGAADLTENDFSVYVEPRRVIPGNAYAMTGLCRPEHLVHSMIGIDSERFIAVESNCGRLVVARFTEVIDFYRELGNDYVQLRTLPHQGLRIIGSDHWQTVAQANSPEILRLYSDGFQEAV